MLLTSPIWLIGLLPWAAVTLWLLWGRRKRTDIPFLPLWLGPVAGQRAKRAVQVPPLALAAAIVTALLAVLAAAGPAVHWLAAGGGLRIAIVVDRGITMSARGDRIERYRETADRAAGPIARALPGRDADLLIIPGPPPARTTIRDWPRHVQDLRPTAIDTRPALRSAILQLLAQTGEPIILLSDQPLGIDDPRLIQIPPSVALQNTGIVRLTAREQPAAQLLVRLRNQSDRPSASLLVRSDNRPTTRPIDLPPRGGERDYFIDLPAVGPVLTVELQAPDALPADDRATLVHRRSWPRIEPLIPLSPPLQRLVEIYTRQQPPGDQSLPLAIASRADQLPRNTPGIVLAASSTPPRPATQPLANLRLTPHPLTEHVNWPAIVPTLSLAPAPADPSWTPLVQLGSQTLLAIRTDPARQVWIGFDPDSWSATSDFVLFWKDAFDWAGQGGQGGQTFTSEPISQLAPEWHRLPPATPAVAPSDNGLWPGLYQRSDGALRALNALDVRLDPPPTSDWPSQLSRLAARDAQPVHRSLSPAFLLAALALMLLSALTWRRPRQFLPAPNPQPTADQ